jgi:integrase
MRLNRRSAVTIKPSKTDAGARTVGVPDPVLPFLAEHLERWAGPERVFVSAYGSPMRGDAIRQAFARARRKVGMKEFTFHDLRHTSQSLAANTGASIKDLMKRAGHASDAAARRYLHAIEGRDAEITAALGEMAKDGNAAKLPRSIIMRPSRA